MERVVDFEGVFTLFASVRTQAPLSGYRPQHAIHENYLTSGEHTYLHCQALEPGHSAEVAVRLSTPEVYPQCLWEGRVLQVSEGLRVVGSVKVTKIMTESLRVAREACSPLWVQPTK